MPPLNRSMVKGQFTHHLLVNKYEFLAPELRDIKDKDFIQTYRLAAVRSPTTVEQKKFA